MPLRGNDFFRGESNGLLGRGCIGEDAGVADEEGHYEERASEIADEGESPVFQHLKDTGATVQGRYRGELLAERVSFEKTDTESRLPRGLTMKLPVQRSAPVKTIATRPKGKIKAANSLITPGAFS